MRTNLENQSEDYPNILLIHCHDLGQHLGCYGHDVETPNIDSLAESGVKFTNYFASAPQCSPSRGSIMTGRYPHENGLMGLAHLGWEYNDGEQTLPMFLREEGYSTHLYGVQHETPLPQEYGFEHRHTDEIEAMTVAADVVESMDQLDDHQPFFASVGFVEPHRDFRADYIPDEAYDRYNPEEVDPLPYLPDQPPIREDIANMNAMITATADKGVGVIMKALRDAGLEEETLTIFTTDHGIAFPRAKGMCYDPGLETALIVHYPGAFDQGKECTEMLSNVDLLPTLLDLLSIEHSNDLSGRSFLPLFTEGTYESRDRIFAEITWHGHYNPIRCIRTEEFKYIRNFADLSKVYLPTDIFPTRSGREVAEEYYVQNRPEEELYDLQADPHESNNLASNKSYSAPLDDRQPSDPRYADILSTLRTELHDWLKETDDPLLDGQVSVRDPKELPSH